LLPLFVFAGNLAELPIMNATLGDDARCFIDENRRVHDALRMEVEQARVNPWTEEEIRIFIHRFLMYPKGFARIASYLENKSTYDVTEFYFRQKHALDLRELLRVSVNGLYTRMK
jgi:hypothetical protein